MSVALGDFHHAIQSWCQADAPRPMECWVDGVNISLHLVGGGVRCSVELLDSTQSHPTAHLQLALAQGGASLACECRGAIALDPHEQCLKLLVWMPLPVAADALMTAIGDLMDQRGAWLSLVNDAIAAQSLPAARRTVLGGWQQGVFNV